ncbi:terpenoid synthase [Exidia glandulosa HHB12029]|uniref:Terpenoid synthase n=1 Tax=Exidia glandulosa HHB12029 TaxID=1314781 RepID=A0A165MVW5_EXIGL|nr:terpenoid synthase [Exidia glandulosa HHB12029]
MDGSSTLAPFIPAGATVVMTVYAHLPADHTRTIIGLLTAYFLYVEDLFEHDVARVQNFNSRFARGEPQNDPALDGLAQLLRELPQHFPLIAANIIVMSFLNLFTGTLLEQATQGASLSQDSTRYAVFVRALSGVQDAYAFFVFPAQLPLESYVQAIPDVGDYLTYSNDILSFYKEELAQDSANHVSTLSAAQGQTKADVLAGLVDTCVSAHERAQRLLAPYPEALQAYLAAAIGSIGFHVVNKRYRLHELDL